MRIMYKNETQKSYMKRRSISLAYSLKTPKLDVLYKAV